jgi:hypothetical protein
MTRKSLNQTAMFESVCVFLNAHATELSSIPAIAAILIQLRAILADIRTLRQIQERTTQAATREKHAQADTVLALMMKITGGMQAYSSVTGDRNIQVLSGFSITSVKTLRESNLADKARTIYEAALPLTEALSAYFVTQADVEALGAAITSYLQALPGRRAVQTETVQSTAEIEAKVAEGKLLLTEHLDLLMLPFRTKNPTLYGQYETARAVVDLAAGRKARVTPPPEAAIGQT